MTERKLKEYWCQEKLEFCQPDGTNSVQQEIAKILDDDMNNKTTIEFAKKISDDDFDLLRELMSYDVLCPASTQFVRGTAGGVSLKLPLSSLHWSRQVEWPWSIKTSNLAKEHNCIDIGGGHSVLAYAIARRCKTHVVTDIDDTTLEWGRNTANLLRFPNIIHVNCDARDLPYQDNTFDRVFCISVLEHIDGDKLKAARECKRILKPGGKLIMTMDIIVGYACSKDTPGAINLTVGNQVTSMMLLPQMMGQDEPLISTTELRCDSIETYDITSEFGAFPDMANIGVGLIGNTLLSVLMINWEK